MRLHIINAQLTCKPQLIYLHLKIIRYYRLRITRDKFHEVILWAWVNPILKSPFQSTHEHCSNTIAMSKTL